MALLAPCYPWWRYPVKPPNSRALNHTTLKGNSRAIYPVRRFNKAACAAYVPQWCKSHHPPYKKGRFKRWSGSKWDETCLTTRDPDRYFKTSYGARSTDGTLSRGPKFCGASSPSSECLYQNKRWELWPARSRRTRHDRLKRHVRKNRPPLIIGVRPDIKELRHRRAVPLVVGTTSDGAALTWNQSQPNHPLTGVGERLVLHGFWTFLGADRHCRCWHFTETPRRKAKRVPPSFREGWKPNRRQNLPAWRGPARLYQIKGKIEGFRPAQFDWKPDHQHYFGAWEQQRFVGWTPTPKL